MNKAVFIDKDGTLIKNVPYNVDPSLVNLENDAAQVLSFLKKNNYLLIVISNQSGIAKGLFSENDLQEVNNEIQRLLLNSGVQLDGFYYCPHLAGGTIKDYSVECDCRKPKPGLLLKAAQDFNIDTGKSWMIGDILDDVEAGKNAGCKTILLDNGNETEWILNGKRIPDYTIKGLGQAAEIIMEGNR